MDDLRERYVALLATARDVICALTASPGSEPSTLRFTDPRPLLDLVALVHRLEERKSPCSG
jgi:hypothetical protein